MPSHNPRQVLAHDSKDSCREIHGLLARLCPLERVRFDAWCCQQASLPGFGTVPRVQRKTWQLAREARWDTGADERLTWEVWFDLWVLANQYAFDLDGALAELVRRARKRPGKP